VHGFSSRVTLEEGTRAVRSFVLRGGRLTALQQRALEAYGPRYTVEFSRQPLSCADLFGNDNPTVVEIGFGMGLSTAEIAAASPDTNYLGIEVFLAGIGRLLHEIARRDLKNIRIIRFNAEDVVREMLPDASTSGFHVFFPDPWPKKKHHKRRLLSAPFLELLSRKLVPGGYIYCVTDWSPYAEWVIEEAKKVPSLKNPSPNGTCEPVPWRPKTKFEMKGIAKQHIISEIWLTTAG
jgi:tRNA (guanine-N7-)-methyltransferase